MLQTKVAEEFKSSFAEQIADITMPAVPRLRVNDHMCLCFASLISLRFKGRISEDIRMVRIRGYEEKSGKGIQIVEEVY